MNHKLILWFLIANAFLGITVLDSGFYYFTITVIEFFFTIRYLPKISNFRFCFILIFISLILNAYSSEHFRGQDFFSTLRAGRWTTNILFFYIVAHYNPGIKQIEKCIEKLILIVLICYLIQLMIFPIAIFHGAAESWIQNNDYWFRGISVRGDVIISLGIFLGLNKYLSTHNKKYIVLMFICLLIYFMKGYRIMLFGITVSSIYLFCRFYGIRNIKKIVTQGFIFSFSIILIIFISYHFIPLIQNGINVIIEKIINGDASFSNDSYIRVLSFNYWETEHFKSGVERFLGSGFVQNNSQWGKYYLNYLLDVKNYNIVDWGLIGLSWLGGIPLIIGIILIYIKCIITKTPKDKYYISAWFIFLTISSLSDPIGYSNNAFIPESIIMFLLHKIITQKRINYANVTNNAFAH